MRSLFLRLGLNDLIKGLITSLFAAVGAYLLTELSAGSVIDKQLWARVGITALATMFGYLSKNLFTNSKGEFAKAEPKI